MLFCIVLSNFIDIEQRTAELWRHNDFENCDRRSCWFLCGVILDCTRCSIVSRSWFFHVFSSPDYCFYFTFSRPNSTSYDVTARWGPAIVNSIVSTTTTDVDRCAIRCDGLLILQKNLLCFCTELYVRRCSCLLPTLLTKSYFKFFLKFLSIVSCVIYWEKLQPTVI